MRTSPIKGEVGNVFAFEILLNC
jgi:hypothetical protein